MHAKIILVFALLSIFTFDPSVLAQETSETPSDEGMTEEETSEEATQDEVSEEETSEEETLEDQCAKTEGNVLDALLCKAVLELQIRVSDLEAGTAGVQEVEEEAPEIELGKEIAEEEVIEETPAEEQVDSPLFQMMSGANPDEIQCKSGQELVFKASNWYPMCVNKSSVIVLALRGWIASYDPSHEDLMKMQDDYMAAHPQEETEAGTETVTEETDAGTETVTEETDAGTETVTEETDAGTETVTEETQGTNHTAVLRESMEMGAN